MTALSEMPTNKLCKLLLIGDSGTGKTGSLCSLAKAGYNVRILAFDPGGGYSVLSHNLSTDEQERVDIQLLYDHMRFVQGLPVPKSAPRAAVRASQLLDNWKKGDSTLGSVEDWGPQDVLAIDSTTAWSISCLNQAMWDRGWTAPRRPHPSEYGAGQQMQTAILNALMAPHTPCHVVCISHIRLIGGDEEDRIDLSAADDKAHKMESRDAREVLMPLKGYATTLGKALPRTTGHFFDYIFRTYVKVSGKRVERFMTSRPDGYVEAKCPIPGLPDPLPIETGLATLFDAASNLETKDD